MYSTVIGWSGLCKNVSINMTDGFVCIFHILIDAFFTCSTHYWERRLAISNHTCGLILFSVLLVFTSCILKILSHTHTFTTVTSWFQQSDFYETLRGFSSCFFSLGFVELPGPVSSEFSLNLKTFQPFLLQVILLTCSFLQLNIMLDYLIPLTNYQCCSFIFQPFFCLILMSFITISSKIIDLFFSSVKSSVNHI